MVTVFLWGSLPLALKAVTGNMDPVTLTWYRHAVSLTILTPVVWRRRLLPSPATISRRMLLWGICVAGFLGNNLAYLWGLGRISPAAAGVVIQLAPLLTLLGAVVFFGERFSRLQYWGMVLLVGGMLAFFHPRLGALLRAEGVQAVGVGWVVLAAACWAAYALAQKALTRDCSSLAVLWMNFAAGLLFLAPASRPTEIEALNPSLFLLLLYCCVNGLIGYSAWAEAMSQWEASRVSAVLANTPLVTILLTWVGSRVYPELFAVEAISWINWAGALAVVGGSMLAAGVRPF